MTDPQRQRIDNPREKPTRALVLGSTGMVGRAWCELLEAMSIPFRALHRPGFDLLNHDSVHNAIEPGDELVINAAAWTDVDGAESQPDLAMRANAESVGTLADRCHDLSAHLLHYSTDYIFHGRANSPYRVDHPADPCNVYGETKSQGESKIRSSPLTDSLVIRTSWVYAPWGKNFVRTIASLAQERSELRVVDDQRGRPSSAQQLVRTSFELYSRGAKGTWHATDAQECTWFEFAQEIARVINPECTVHPCTTDEFPRPAFRPPYSVLDISETEDLCGPIETWQQSLHHVLHELKRSQSI